ncbi:hypothetical protein Tco_0024061 [Tanacetum coccineum]
MEILPVSTSNSTAVVVPSGESKFEVGNGYEAYRVDERLKTCSCRAWKLFGIPFAYSSYIEGMNGMDQWPTTEYTKPLPQIVKKMFGRPPHKIKRYAGGKDDGNRTSLLRSSKTARGGSSTRGDKTAIGGISARGSKSVNASASVSGGESVDASGSTRGGNMQGIPVPAWLYDGTLDDLLGAEEIQVTNTQPMASQDPIDEPLPIVHASPTIPLLPAPTIPPAPIMRREFERIKQINFKKPLSPGLGLIPEDAMVVE